MERNYFAALDFENLSGVSDGQINPEHRLVDMETKVREAYEYAKGSRSKSKKIRLEK